MPESRPNCIVCRRTDAEVPLLSLQAQGGTYHICPAHLPILIHHPEQLADLLPGAAALKDPAGHGPHGG